MASLLDLPGGFKSIVFEYYW